MSSSTASTQRASGRLAALFAMTALGTVAPLPVEARPLEDSSTVQDVEWLAESLGRLLTPRSAGAAPGGHTMSQSTSREVSAYEVVALRNFYRIESAERPAIEQFLRAHPAVFPVLLEASRHLLAHFPEAGATLRHETDPELGDTQLVVMLTPHLPAEDFLARLEAFDRDWWLEASRRVDGLLTIGI